MKQLLTNGIVFDGEQLLENHAVALDGRIITDVVELAADAAADLSSHFDTVTDLRGHVLAPGLIDLQVNGGGGVLFNDRPDIDALRTIAGAHRQFGTTSFLPTLISDDAGVMRHGIDAVAAALCDDLPGVAGIHLEGPHLNPEYCGVHDAGKIRALDQSAQDLLTSLEGGCTLLTLAPETVVPDTVRQLADAGIVVFGGHSAASYEQTREALQAGLSGFTHLFNAMPPLLSRAPGMVGAALEDEHSYIGIIADGHHVHPAMLRLTIRAKSRGKVVLVSDAMPTVGSQDNSFTLNGVTIRAERGRCITPDGALAGADIGMIDAVRNICRVGGVDRYEALRMASRYPAAAVGLADMLGSIRAGFKADLIELDADLNVVRSWIAGDAVEH